MSAETASPLRNGNPQFDLRALPCCGARTRAGTACRQPRMANGRCRLHGGRATGPRTEDGKARQQAAVTRHGLYSRDARLLFRFVRLMRQATRRMKQGDRPLPHHGTYGAWLLGGADWRGRWAPTSRGTPPTPSTHARHARPPDRGNHNDAPAGPRPGAERPSAVPAIRPAHRRDADRTGPRRTGRVQTRVAGRNPRRRALRVGRWCGGNGRRARWPPTGPPLTTDRLHRAGPPAGRVAAMAHAVAG